MKVVVFTLLPRLAGRLTRLELADRSPFVLRWHTSDAKVLQQCILERQYDLPYGLEQCRLVIDGGANIGASSNFFAALFPAAHVVAVEPDEATFALLQANTATNPRITCVRGALWPTNEPLELFDPGIGPWGMRVVPAAGGSVAAVTVAELLDHYTAGEGEILLKLDVEGAEREILHASSGWIDSIDAIAAETHERYVEGAASAFTSATVGFRRGVERGEVWMVSRT